MRVQFDLDDLRFPRTWACITNPREPEVAAAAEQLLVRLRLLERHTEATRRFNALRLARLSSYIYPHAELGRLRVCNDVMSYFFLLDDRADADEAIGKRPEVLWSVVSEHIFALRFGDRAPVNDALTALLIDIHARMRAFAPHVWLTRFATNMRDYLVEGTVAAAHNWTDGTVPDPDAYLLQRLHDVAGYPAQDLIELAGGFSLPEAVRMEPRFLELRAICTRVVAYTNDLVSFQTEDAVDNPNNMLRVMQTHLGWDMERAVRHVMAAINDDLERYAALEQDFPHYNASIDGWLRRYRESQKGLMRGNLLWSLESARYRSPDSPFAQLRAEPTLRRGSAQLVT